jgi:hydrogenase expression/formation protein HypE
VSEKITLAQGSGGVETKRLIESIFAKHFYNGKTQNMPDAAIVQGGNKLAFTTDSFVVEPLFFNGGDIGRLAVCGTINDLLTTGATPIALSCGFIIQAGFDVAKLEVIADSMAQTAKEASVQIVTGDTKVIEPPQNGSSTAANSAQNPQSNIFINTSGIGRFDFEPLQLENITLGDAIIVTGCLGTHHATIQSARMGFSNNIASDAAPLCEIVQSLQCSGVHLHAMRDITRGGLATVLCEIFENTPYAAEIEEAKLPVLPQVASFAQILGLDILHMGNEGNMLVFVPQSSAEAALKIIKACKYGQNAAIIGQVGNVKKPVLKTRIGGTRILRPLMGEGLPRIC